MKNNILKIIGILILVILQLSFLSKLSVLTFVPNVIFTLSIILILKGYLSDSLLVAVFGGLLLDLASSYRFGFYTFILILILLFLYFVILKNLPAINPILIFLITLCAFIFFDLISCLILKIWPNWQLLINGGINALLGLIIFYILEKYEKHEEIKFS